MPPAGDPVELFVELPGTTPQRVRVEEILFDQVRETVASGPWVYSGSTFVAAPDGPEFMAELDGVLIGLMHGPSAIIDNPRNDLLGRFGAIILNPAARQGRHERLRDHPRPAAAWAAQAELNVSCLSSPEVS